MSQFADCRIEVVSALGGGPDFEADDCELTLDGQSINIFYFDDDGPVVFDGHETTPGCFELVCRSRPRVATLERRNEVLEGSWEEQGARGSWRILLPARAVG